MPTETAPAAASKALTPAERKQLDQLLAREAATRDPHAPEVRIGEPYVALTNLSVPRRGKVAPGEVPQVDLVRAGETVYLTDAEARAFNRHEQRDGRRIPVVRKVHGTDETDLSAVTPGRIHPSYLSGPLFRPPAPQPGSDQARPDPEGSSRIVEMNPPVIPEASPPQVGSENYTTAQDAVDILPGGKLATEIRRGADQDVVAAARAHMENQQRR